jgi:hypothetical protein
LWATNEGVNHSSYLHKGSEVHCGQFKEYKTKKLKDMSIGQCCHERLSSVFLEHKEFWILISVVRNVGIHQRVSLTHIIIYVG